MTRYIFEVIVDTDEEPDKVLYQMVRALEDRGQVFEDALFHKTEEKQSVRDVWKVWRDMFWNATVCRVEKSGIPISRVMLVRGTSSSRRTGNES